MTAKWLIQISPALSMPNGAPTNPEPAKAEGGVKVALPRAAREAAPRRPSQREPHRVQSFAKRGRGR